jgi:hypothetical protein
MAADPTPNEPDDGPLANEPDDGPIALADRWWWSSTLSLGLGIVVVVLQVQSLTSGSAVWLNWVVAALGTAAALYGLVGLLRAYAKVRSESA